jgi:hypothetical protein
MPRRVIPYIGSPSVTSFVQVVNQALHKPGAKRVVEAWKRIAECRLDCGAANTTFTFEASVVCCTLCFPHRSSYFATIRAPIVLVHLIVSTILMDSLC